MSKPLYTVQHVANFFLEKGDAEGRELTSLKLLKLVYIAYGWVLALTGKKLFEDEIQAWQHGPVVPALYTSLNIFEKIQSLRKLHASIWILLISPYPQFLIQIGMSSLYLKASGKHIRGSRHGL